MIQGEVAVNKRVDGKSYTSLHKLVDDMFPPQTYTEQVCRLDFPLSCVSTGLDIQCF
jgi:hypothetical protein